VPPAAQPKPKPKPQPLPPEQRSAGQLVAEALQLYGERFTRALPLGLSVAALNQFRDVDPRWLLPLAAAGSIALAASYLGATVLAADVELTRRTALTALAAGVVAFLPLALLLGTFNILGVAWVAFVGLAVPAALIERTGFRGALRRGIRLARADYVHALGSLAALALVYFLTSIMLGVLLRSQGEQTERIALFLSDLVLSPLVFLGAALLYFDQAARAEASSVRERTPSLR
jgi:hypothetical protein